MADKNQEAYIEAGRILRELRDERRNDSEPESPFLGDTSTLDIRVPEPIRYNTADSKPGHRRWRRPPQR